MYEIKPRCYVMAPYTKPEGQEEENARRVIAAANILTDHDAVPFVPLLSHYWNLQHKHPWKFWIEYDLHWLLTCHFAVRLNIGVPSAGADIEQFVAETQQIPVFDWAWSDRVQTPSVPTLILAWIHAWREQHA